MPKHVVVVYILSIVKFCIIRTTITCKVLTIKYTLKNQKCLIRTSNYIFLSFFRIPKQLMQNRCSVNYTSDLAFTLQTKLNAINDKALRPSIGDFM